MASKSTPLAVKGSIQIPKFNKARISEVLRERKPYNLQLPEDVEADLKEAGLEWYFELNQPTEIERSRGLGWEVLPRADGAPYELLEMVVMVRPAEIRKARDAKIQGASRAKETAMYDEYRAKLKSATGGQGDGFAKITEDQEEQLDF